MLSTQHWQQQLSLALNYFFSVLAEADTPESWGEATIPKSQERQNPVV